MGLDTVAWMVLPLIYIALAASHEVADERASLANLAHGGFFALGAYGFALGLDQDRAPQTAVILAVLLPVAVGTIVAPGLLQLRDARSFALATFVAFVALRVLALSVEGLTGGAGSIAINFLYRPDIVYYAALVVAAWTVWTLYREARAGRGQRLYARIRAFVIGAAQAGLAGIVLVMHTRRVDPEMVLSLELAVLPWLMATVGGRGMPTGPVAGALVVLAVHALAGPQALWARLAIDGTLLLVAWRLLPHGLVGLPLLGRALASVGLVRRADALDR